MADVAQTGIDHLIIQGTDENDLLIGTAESETLIGGAGRDEFVHSGGGDLMLGGADEDDLEGVNGDTLVGGTGNDHIRLLTRPSSPLPAVAIFNPGDGRDIIQYSYDGNVIHLGGGLRPDDLKLSLLSSGALEVQYGQSDALVLSGFRTDALNHGFVLAFDDGTVLDRQDLIAVLAGPTEGNDTLYGVSDVTEIHAGGGDDVVHISELMPFYQDYSVDGGAGDDSLYASNAYGGTGNDLLFGRYVNGGPGDDTLTGVWAVDASFDAGWGRDVVNLSGKCTLHLPEGVRPEALQIGRLGAVQSDAIALTFKGLSDEILLTGLDKLSGASLSFADGSVVTGEMILAAATQPLNLSLQGTKGADQLRGGDGRDTLEGLAGSDSLSGGRGDDLLLGGKGGDTYYFARGDGHDTVVDSDKSLFQSDRLYIQGASSNQVWLTRSGRDLDISILGTQDKVTITDWFSGLSHRIEKITATGDGKTLTASHVNALVNVMARFDAPVDGVLALPPDTPRALVKVVTNSWC
jgi:Ca2+-binding RTX toxin-like protein